MVSADGGRELSIELTASPILGPEDVLTGAVVIMHDVTEMRGLTRRISYQAAHDALTGLINRAEFERRLEQGLDTVREDGTSHVLCYMDLDRFKAVNDTCGHLAGDNLLREIAKLIRDEVRDSDVVARLGGDEFGMLLIRCPLDKARQIAGDVCNAVRDYRFVWQDRIFTVGISIGLVEVGRDNASIKDLLNAADSACYMAKQEGRGRVHVYSARDEVTATPARRIHWLRQLQSAARGPFRAAHPADHFHRRTDPGGAGRRGPAADDRRRGDHPPAAAVHPGRRTLPAHGEHRPVGGAVDAVGDRPGRHTPAGPAQLLHQPVGAVAGRGGVPRIRRRLSRPQPDRPRPDLLRGQRGGGDSRFDQARRFVAVLHGMGCQFGLDDFGSGFGSFTTLRDLAIDYLKIDGVYTRDVRPETLNHQVVGAITGMAKVLGFKVVAEQVETQADFERCAPWAWTSCRTLHRSPAPPGKTQAAPVGRLRGV